MHEALDGVASRGRLMHSDDRVLTISTKHTRRHLMCFCTLSYAQHCWSRVHVKFAMEIAHVIARRGLWEGVRDKRTIDRLLQADMSSGLDNPIAIHVG